MLDVLHHFIASNLETVWAPYLPPPAILPLPQGAAVVEKINMNTGIGPPARP